MGNTKLLRPPAIRPFRGIQRPRWPVTLNRDSPQAERITAHWPMLPAGGNIAHELVRGLNGTLTGMDLATAWTSDIEMTSGLLFDGLNDFVTVPHDADLQPAGTDGAFSVCCWVKVLTEGDWLAFLSKDQDGASGIYRFQIDNTAAPNRLWVFGIKKLIGGTNVLKSTTTVQTTSFVHICGTWDGTTQRIFINGIEENSDTPTTGFEHANPLEFGRNSGGQNANCVLLHISFYKGLAVDPKVIYQMWDPPTRWQLQYERGRVFYSIPAAAAFTMVADSGVYALAGSAISPGIKMPAASGVYAKTGSAIAPKISMPGASGTYNVVGSDILPAIKMPADSGVYSLVGSAALTQIGMPAAFGLYNLAGSAILTKIGLPAASGVYALVGSDTNLLKGFVLLAESGVYNLVGSDIAIDFIMVAESGVYAITGSSATLIHGVPSLANIVSWLRRRRRAG